MSEIFGAEYSITVSLLKEMVDYIYSKDNFEENENVEQLENNNNNEIKKEEVNEIENKEEMAKINNDEISLHFMVERLDKAIKTERFQYGPRNEQIMSLRSMLDEIIC